MRARFSVALALGTLLAVACSKSESSHGGNGTNDASTDGSTSAAGGSDDSGGSTGNGGASGRGGSTGNGGSVGPGGSIGSGGATASGGSRGSGGSAGSGGSGGVIGAGGGACVTGAGGSGDVDGSTGRTYTTLFPLTENPISEGGNWISGGTTGLDWHDVSTTPGLAIGHQSLTSYTDGTALLTGTWGPTQSVEAVVHAQNQRDSCYQEVEMRLRSSLSAHSCTGYEISFKASTTGAAYLIIVRWNGPLGDFTYLNRSDGAQYGVVDGDVVKATIVGNVITAYLNGVQMGTATDSTYASGSPGMGFNLETADSACLGTNGDYGFTCLTATGK